MALTLKRGDTLSRTCFLPEGWLPAGTWSAAGKLRKTDDTEVAGFTVTLTPPTGDELRYMLSIYAGAAATAQWPLERLRGDVEFTDASADPEPFKFSSKTFEVNVVKDFTWA